MQDEDLDYQKHKDNFGKVSVWVPGSGEPALGGGTCGPVKEDSTCALQSAV